MTTPNILQPEHIEVIMNVEVPGLLSRLRTVADEEGLLSWSPAVAERGRAGALDVAQAAGAVLVYRAGRPRTRYVYLVGAESGDGSSDLPPPSIQSGATLLAYRHRDKDTCHLCTNPISRAWNRPREWPSLDHLVPRALGGTNYPSNIKVAHVSCNKARRDRPVTQFNGSPLTRELSAVAR